MPTLIQIPLDPYGPDGATTGGANFGDVSANGRWVAYSTSRAAYDEESNFVSADLQVNLLDRSSGTTTRIYEAALEEGAAGRARLRAVRERRRRHRRQR